MSNARPRRVDNRGMAKLDIRFGLGTILGAVGGFLIGAGFVLIRTGLALEELGWFTSLFAPSGRPHVLQGALLMTAGIVVVLASALKRAKKRRSRR